MGELSSTIRDSAMGERRGGWGMGGKGKEKRERWQSLAFALVPDTSHHTIIRVVKIMRQWRVGALDP